MIFTLMLKTLARGKARFACAAAGVAAAVGAVVFMFSLTATNDAQAPAIAERLAAPWTCWRFASSDESERPARAGTPHGRNGPRPDLELDLVGLSIDYRPGGHVLQGPPLRITLAAAPAENPYANAPLTVGRWIDDTSDEPEIVATRGSMMRFGRGTPPPLGSFVTFVGRAGTLRAKLVGLLDAMKTPPSFPGAFANKATFRLLGREEHGTLSLWRTFPEAFQGAACPVNLRTPATVAPLFQSDARRNADRARPLLLWAAALTALCLLVNSLLLSVEANRRNVAVLRIVGLTRGGAGRLVLFESLAAASVGAFVGTVFAFLSLVVYVALDTEMYPFGCVFAWRAVGVALTASLVLAGTAALLALRPALAVRPLEAASAAPLPRKQRAGMTIAFACGFAAFVAVEVWGSSLMKVFVPSPEWPDAIVSLLPGGVSAFDIARLQNVKGVRKIAELVPLQMNFEPEEPLKGFGAKPPAGVAGGRHGRAMVKPCRNTLLLASDWLPDFRFVEGTRREALQELARTNACVITAMMARARKLKKGDVLVLASGTGERKFVAQLPIAGIIDLNWHLVTSRGLVRGLNRMPVNTDGPAFVSFDTIESLDARPAPMVRMTHLWLDYQPTFLKEKGVFPAGRAVEAEIRAALGDPADAAIQLHARDEVADGTLAHGDDIIGSMARIPFIFLAVLSIGFVAQLAASADAHRRAFTVLRAVGATRAQLAGRLAAEAFRTAVVGILVGTPCGALAGWLFTSGTRAAMANWGLPAAFAIPWIVIAEGAVGALLFALFAAVPTAGFLVTHRREIRED